MRQHLENFLVWALGKLNIERLKALTIDEHRVTIGFSKFLPDDDKWHNVALTTTFWLKRPQGGSATVYDEVALYIDGKLASEHKLSNEPINS